MGILDRFRKADLGLDVEEDELLREALGYKSKNKRKTARKAEPKKKKSRQDLQSAAKLLNKKAKVSKKAKVGSRAAGRTRKALKVAAHSENVTRATLGRLEKEIKALTKEASRLAEENFKLKQDQKHDVKNLRDEIRAIGVAFDPAVIRGLTADINLISKRLREMEKEENHTLMSVGSIDKKLTNIERRALEVESDYKHAKTSADELQKKSDELKHTARIFMKQMDDFHSKTNAEFSRVVDIERQLEVMQQRMAQLEDVKLSSSAMENAIAQNSKTLSELARKLEYLERTARRTVVLD